MRRAQAERLKDPSLKLLRPITSARWHTVWIDLVLRATRPTFERRRLICVQSCFSAT